MKRLITGTLSILLIAGFVTGCADEEADAQTATATTTQAPPALPADVQQVSTDMALGTAVGGTTTDAAGTSTIATPVDENTLSVTGEFVSPVRSELAPKLGGRVARIHVQEGARVSRGQAVLELESDYIRLNLQAAQAEVARAKAALDEAGRDLERKKELIGKESIPRATYDRSQAVFEQAQAAHAAASAQLALLRQHLADSTVRSPINGVIAEKRTDVGARLGDSAVAFVVVQISPLKLRFAVPERYLGRINVGDRVNAKVEPYPNEQFAGVVKTVGGVIDPQTRTMFAEAEFPNRDGRLRPGLFAKVEVKLE